MLGLLHGTIDISSGNLDSYLAADAVVLDECSGVNAGIPLDGYFTTASWAVK